MTLPADYFETFAEYEGPFLEKYEGAYISKPHIRVKKNGKAIALAPWGVPGSVSPIVFPFAHFFVVSLINETQDDLETFVFENTVLLSFFKNNFQVEEVESPFPHILLKMPHVANNKEEEKKFIEDLLQLPYLGKKE